MLINTVLISNNAVLISNTLINKKPADGTTNMVLAGFDLLFRYCSYIL